MRSVIYLSLCLILFSSCATHYKKVSPKNGNKYGRENKIKSLNTSKYKKIHSSNVVRIHTDMTVEEINYLREEEWKKLKVTYYRQYRDGKYNYVLFKVRKGQKGKGEIPVMGRRDFLFNLKK